MVEQANKRHDDNQDESNEVERPIKRARINVDSAGKLATEARNTLSQNDASEMDEIEEDTVNEPEETRPSDLYLDTINRVVLDFDFEKVCSVSLSNINIYGCLVCGKYFQGRGRKSYAYAHSIHDDHHVFINLETTKVYVLPDGYPVSDPSLEDISYVLAPTFTRNSIANLSSPSHLTRPSYDLNHKPYLSGFVGLNNIKRNDHMNVIIHALVHVPPLRDYLLLSNFHGKESELLKRFAGLAKKIWNPRLFKSQVSPHEFLQEVNRSSAGKFRLEEQGTLSNSWAGIIFRAFQGEVRVETQQVLVRPDSGQNEKPKFDIDRDSRTAVSPFLFLAVDLPPPPLFQDSVEKNIIPQVSIHSVLSKYDGRTAQESAGHLRRYKCQHLPPYIIVHFKRFTKNAFVEEKNPTIINFPLRGLDFKEYVDAPPDNISTLYDLIANVTHESVAGTTRDKENTVWKAHLRAAGGGGDNEKWFMIQDLIVEETRKEMIFLGETIIQIWERRKEAQ
ncbi:spindle pole body protein [Pholiota molesta]|nr:spindle pole body protein [Pholiota molesta]